MKNTPLRFGQFLRPRHAYDWYFGLGIWLIYALWAAYIAINYTVIFDARIPWDAYFSFDNRAIVLTGGGIERHPLANYFFDQMRQFCLWISGQRYNMLFRCSLAFFSVTTVSYTVFLVQQYLRYFLHLPRAISVMIALFYASFSTNILLCFTPETYTYSQLFLVMFVCYTAHKYQIQQKINALVLSIFAVSIGGMTITNVLKCYIPLLFQAKRLFSFKNLGNIALKISISASALILLYLNRINFNWRFIFEKSTEQYERFSQPKHVPLWDMIYAWFFGGSTLFSDFITRDYHSKENYHFNAIFMDVYPDVWHYALVAALLLIIVWAWLKNFKNPLVQGLMIGFGFDIIIHTILKFGLSTAYIYGGHFVYVYPLLMGFLYKSYAHNTKMKTYLSYLLVGLWLAYLGLNIYHANLFLDLLDVNYRKGA
jgi:Family of unknown function (DUF6080)